MILSGVGKRSILDLSKAERRAIRQKNLEIACRLNPFDRRRKSLRMAEAKVKWDQFLAEERRKRERRIIIP